MDITIKGRTPPSRHKINWDGWDGVQQGGKCVYCGCPHSQHDGTALFGRRPGRSRRQRLGLAQYNCPACAKAKGTHQAVCYLAPRGVYQRGGKAGVDSEPRPARLTERRETMDYRVKEQRQAERERVDAEVAHQIHNGIIGNAACGPLSRKAWKEYQQRQNG